jgi:hypothetical protein
MMQDIRRLLSDSHIAAVTIAVLLLWSMNDAFYALWTPTARVSAYLFQAVATMDFTTDSSKATNMTQNAMLISAGFSMYVAGVTLIAAIVLSQWVYGTGPFHALNRCRKSLIGRQNA